MVSDPYKGCVYLATNTANGSIYIGKTVLGMHRRMKTHFAAVRRGEMQPFICALRKHGEASFVWSELFLSEDHASLMAAEIALIACYKAAGWRMYNATSGGDGASRVRPQAERDRMRGRKVNEEGRANIRASWTPERRAALAERMKSRVVSEESKARMSAASRGKAKSAEHVAKCVIGRAGTVMPKWTAERRAKMEAAATKGVYVKSQETKDRISVTKRARFTEEDRARCSVMGKAGAAKRWQS